MKPSKNSVPSLAQLALKYGTVNSDQFKKAQDFIQKKASLGETYLLEDVLILKKMATRYQINLLQLIREFLVLKKKGEQFGQIAVQKGYATNEEVELALTRQQQLFREAKVQKMLGDLLVEFGVITEEQSRIIAEEQKKLEDIPLEPPPPADNREKAVFDEQGKPLKTEEDEIRFKETEKEFLKLRALDTDFALNVVEKGFATVDAVEAAMAIQNEWFEKFRKLHMLGDIMVSEGVLTERQRDAVLSHQKRLRSKESPTSPERSDLAPSAFPAPPEISVPPKDRDPHTLELPGNIDVTLSDSRMEAWVRIEEHQAEPEREEETQGREELQQDEVLQPGAYHAEKITPHHIRTVLEHKGITHGICSNAVIQSYLDKKELFFPAALGEHLYGDAPRYQFDIHGNKDNSPLKKNKTLALLKSPDIKVQALDVTGKTVNNPWITPRHTLLRRGNGVAVSEDGICMLSTQSGYPALSLEGRLHIFPVVNILGDADVRFGPIEKYASVNVAGVLTGAYRVKAGSVKAREIRGCTLDALGDVTAEMGLIDCTINIQGSVKAKYIHNCRIEAFGDVVVNHEIIDSTLIISGACHTPNGRLIASYVSAGKGITAAGMGSDVTEPCQLKVGCKEHIVLQSLRITRQIRESEKSLEDIIEKRELLLEKSEKIFNKMVDLKLLHDRAKGKFLGFNKELAGGNITQGTESHGKTLRLIDALEEKMESAITALRKYNKQKKLTDKHIKETDKNIKVVSAKVQQKIFFLEMDRNRFMQWTESRTTVPEILVSGRIAQGTIISGVFASQTLNDDFRNVKLTEKREKNSTTDYRIHMQLL